jgi:hypothetical protein
MRRNDMSLGSVIRHGDGGLSNGSVYCGPSGCMSLQ